MSHVVEHSKSTQRDGWSRATVPLDAKDEQFLESIMERSLFIVAQLFHPQTI